MDSITIKIPRRLSARVSRMARERRVSRSEIVRLALETLPEEQGETLIDRLGHLLGSAKGLPRTLSSDRRHLRGFGK